MADITQGYIWLPHELINGFALYLLPLILGCIVVTPFFLGAYWLIRRFLK